MPEKLGYARMTFIRVKPGRERTFLALMKTRVFPGVSKEKGIRRIYILRAASSPAEFISLTLWDSKREADAYESSGHYATYRDAVAGEFRDTPVLSQYHVEYHTVSPSLSRTKAGKSTGSQKRIRRA